MSENISILLAFSAGLLSFLSPCILPLVPAYLTYLVGDLSDRSRNAIPERKVLMKALGFVLGFSLVFILLGASASTLGKLLGSNTAVLRILGGTIIILFGIHISGLVKIPFLYKEYRVVEMQKIPSFSSILLGMAFAAGWTPCIGPILASILIVAGNQSTIWQGVTLLTFYSLGLSLPFLLFALTIENVREQVAKWTKYMPVVSAISGIVLVLMGILVLSDRLKYLGRFFI